MILLALREESHRSDIVNVIITQKVTGHETISKKLTEQNIIKQTKNDLNIHIQKPSQIKKGQIGD